MYLFLSLTTLELVTTIAWALTTEAKQSLLIQSSLIQYPICYLITAEINEHLEWISLNVPHLDFFLFGFLIKYTGFFWVLFAEKLNVPVPLPGHLPNVNKGFSAPRPILYPSFMDMLLTNQPANKHAASLA